MFAIPWLRLAPYLAGLALIIGVGAYAHHKGYASGSAVVQAKFDKYAQDVTDLATATMIANQKREAEERDANSKVVAKYQSEIAKSSRYGAELARRLRYALAQAGSSAVPESPDKPGAVDPGTPGGTDALANAIGDAGAECRNNAEQLDALISEIRSQT